MNKSLRKKLGSFTGAFGDLGVLLPLLLGLSAFNGVNLPVALAGVGGVYVLSALFFRQPVPVQPLKVACTLALGAGLAPSVLAAAAWQMGLILMLLGLTGWAGRLRRLFDQPLIRGIQMGVGLILIHGGFQLLCRGMTLPATPALTHPWVWPSSYEAWLAFTVLVIPQLPVTLSNAVVGSSNVAHRYFRWLAKRITPSTLCLSMGAANLAMGMLSGIPVCHGSSGWTAHKKSGARNFRSTVFLGMLLIALAWAFRQRSLELLAWAPIPVLAMLLIYVGLRHAMLVLDLAADKKGFALALAAGIISFATKNPAIGLAIGLGFQYGLKKATPSPLVGEGWDGGYRLTPYTPRLNPPPQGRRRFM